MPEKVKSILSQLISFPVIGGQSNLSILEFITDFLKQHHVPFYLVPNESETKASLFCRFGPEKDGGVILSGHMDVVTVEGQAWSKPPFELMHEDGKLYGRGTADMKGFLACCLACVPQLLSANLQRPIYFAFSYDEEIGCLAAPALIEKLLHTYPERPSYAIIGEPSMLHPVIGHKGISIFETHVNGSAGHSSRIKQEVSAIHEAAKLILWLEQKMDSLIESGYKNEMFDPPHSSIHIGMIQGGIAPNVISDQCTFKWDIRTMPGDDVTEILAEFNDHCYERMSLRRSIFADFEIRTYPYHPPVPPLYTTQDQDVIPLIQRLSGKEELRTVSFASEAGQFSNAGLQAVICGPGSIAQAHRADEFITESQLELGVNFIQKLIQVCGHHF